MKKLFRKTTSTFGSSPRAFSVQGAQVAWSLCVAIAVAIFALQQAMGSRRTHNSSMAAPIVDSRAPAAQKPVPLSQEDLRSPENSLQ